MVIMRQLGGGLVLILAFALLVALGWKLSEKVDHFALARSDSDAWNFAQVEVAYNRFHLALQNGLIESQIEGQLSTSSRAAILERFNIFYARVDTVAERYDMFKARPDVETTLKDLQQVRDGLTVLVDDGRYVTEPQLIEMLAAVRADLPSVREFALAAMLAGIEDQEAERKNVLASLTTAFVTLSALILVMLILGGWLVFLWWSLAKKNASERNLTSYLARMLDVSSDGIIVVNRNLRIVNVNRTAERIFRQHRAALLGSDAMAELSPRRGRAAMTARLRALLDRPDGPSTEMRSIPVLARRGDETLFPAELSVVRVRDQKRRPVLVGFVRDLSVERKARRRTRRALAQARRDAAAKQRFLSTMSHEMRTPLHSIVVAADMAEKSGKASGGQSYLPKVRSAAQTALQQVEDVLDAARDSEDARRAPPETFDARAVARSVFLQMQPLAAERGNELVFDWSVPALLDGQPRALFRVVHNLVSNAVKATEDGTVTIRASESHLASQPALLLEVADTGTGISETDAQNIFTDFISGFRKKAHMGTGLGLGIVRKAVQNLGGRIDLQSAPGKGSTFRVLIPLSNKATQFETAPAPLAEDEHGVAPSSEGRSCRGRNVLLIEDHATNRELLEGMLATMGCTVTAADDGLKGLRIALETSFDLILTDLNMPGLTGETVAMCLRHSSRSGNACIIAATAKATMSQMDQDSIVAGGIDAFLFKPFDSARLEAVICDALEERALARGDDIPDETDATSDPDMLARSAQDLREVLALLPGDGAPTAASDLEELARMAHHAGGALLCIGYRRLGHALLELERICGSQDAEDLRGMAIVLDTEIKQFLSRAGAPVAPV